MCGEEYPNPRIVHSQVKSALGSSFPLGHFSLLQSLSCFLFTSFPPLGFVSSHCVTFLFFCWGKIVALNCSHQEVGDLSSWKCYPPAGCLHFNKGFLGHCWTQRTELDGGIWGSRIPREGDILSLGPSSYTDRWCPGCRARSAVSEKPSLSHCHSTTCSAQTHVSLKVKSLGGTGKGRLLTGLDIIKDWSAACTDSLRKT